MIDLAKNEFNLVYCTSMALKSNLVDYELTRCSYEATFEENQSVKVNRIL